MTEVRKDIVSGRWVITGTKNVDEFFSSLKPEEKDVKKCPFCLGNEHLTRLEIYALRKNHTPPNTPGWSIRVIPAITGFLRIEGDLRRRGVGMYDAMDNIGAHEIIVESAEHIKNISDLPTEQIRKVLRIYQERIIDLEKDKRLKYCLIFKNQRPKSPYRVGHTHSQLVGLAATPKAIKDELLNSRQYYGYKERCLFCDLIHQESLDKKRIVEENDDCLAFIPYAARFAFETWIIPKIHNPDFSQEKESSLSNLAQILKNSLQRIVKLLNDPPLNYAFHTIPYLRIRPGYWTTVQKDYHWHLEICPQITEVSGFEWGSGFQVQPLVPELCAQLLRETII